MTAARRKNEPDLDVSFQVDADELAELEELRGQRLLHAVVWEDSVADALEDVEFTDSAMDVDIYLADGVRFELYAVLSYDSLDGEPFDSAAELARRLIELSGAGAWLEDVASDTEDDLVIVLADGQTTLYLNAGAWTVGDWEELPE